MTAVDVTHMRHALRLAARGLGRVAPNPSVGCVIVDMAGRIIGRGWTQPGGRPHAETMALAQAGAAANGATAYVTLEPCAHHGQTPPCADALVQAGLASVVVALQDPDPRVSGKGVARLRDAGVAVTMSVCEAEARAMNIGFLTRIEKSRPIVMLKIAQSADGRVADVAGKSKWITGERARAHGHLLRARSDAIIVGIGTALIDDPELTCRLHGMANRTPLRVVLDTHLRFPANSRLARSAGEYPVLVFTTSIEKRDWPKGVEIVVVAADVQGRPDHRAVLSELGRRGLTRVLVEGGPKLHAALLTQKLADRIYLYRAPLVLGGAGLAAIAPLDFRLEAAPRLKLLERVELGPDLVESYAVTG